LLSWNPDVFVLTPSLSFVEEQYFRAVTILDVVVVNCHYFSWMKEKFVIFDAKESNAT
jgi:hypothetical protein